MRRPRPARVLWGALVALSVGVTGCGIIGGPPQATPTQDIFVKLTERKNELKAQCRQLLDQDNPREALLRCEDAQVFAREPDPELDALTAQARAALQPSPTATIPPSAATATAAPAAVPTMNPTAPDTALGLDYFGQVFLVKVPSSAGGPVPSPQDVFGRGDQAGLFLESFAQGLRLPFAIRVFNRDTGILLGEVRFGPPPTPGPGAAPVAPPPVVFFDKFVWYHSGAELPGNYRVELYADTILTATLNFQVTEAGLPPAATPGVVAAAATATLAPGQTPGVTIPTPLPSAQRPPALPTPRVAPETAPGAPTVVELPTVPPPTPTITPSPTPATAFQVLTGGIAAGIAYNAGIDRLYVADSSGVIWSIQDGQPVLKPPFKITAERPGSLENGGTDRPSSIALDPRTGFVYVGLKRSQAIGVYHGLTGERLKTLNLPARPAKIAVNTIQHLVYAIVPERNVTVIMDPDQPTPIIATANTPQATDIVVSDDGTTLFVSHLTGELSAFDARTGQLFSRVEISPPGLYSIAQSQGFIAAINVVQKQLIVVDPQAWQVTQRIDIKQDPSQADSPGMLPTALIAGPITGTVYVLAMADPVNQAAAPIAPQLLNYNPQSGAFNGKLQLSNLAGNQSNSPVGATGDDTNLMSLNNSMAVNPFSEIVYLVNPSAGQISVAAPCLFPNLSQTSAGRNLQRPDWLCPGG